MNQMRKPLLVLLGLLTAGSGFFLYLWLSPTAPSPSANQPNSDSSIPVRQLSGGQQIGDTSVKIVENSRWIRRDPVTKKAVEVGGFSKLLTPPEGSAFWLVESPYLIRYEDRFTCRIDAHRGRIQMEQSGDLPSNVELMDQVVLQITHADRKGPEEQTHIYLDNLNYSSERSEFSTDGPVRVVSRRAELKGRGLILIYNPRFGRMEYLEIRDLDYLLVKEGGAPWRQEGPSSEKAVSKEGDESPVQFQDPSAEPKDPAAESAAAGDKVASGHLLYYQCSIQNNVVIQYGRELVVVGADQVNIHQILWQGGSAGESGSLQETQSVSQTPSGDQTRISKMDSTDQADLSKGQPELPASDPVDTMGRDDVLITCDGGIIIQPMDSASSAAEEASLPSVEMAGQLHIERIADIPSEARIPLANCSSLRYVLRDEILELFTDSPQNPIQIYLDQTGNMIETLGMVFWDRRANLARVDGPGKVYFSGDSLSDREEKRELAFAGLMDLEFADKARVLDDSSLTLKTINLTGGMEAFLYDQGIRSRARQARFTFHPSNKPDTLDLKGDVRFETVAEGQQSQVQAQETVLHFDSAGQVHTANLTGQVRMTSSGQMVQADTADIQFHQGEDGRVVPGQVRLEGKSQIESTAQTDVPPTRFEAIQIDYDLQGGKAIAAGPIRFTFYTPSDETNDFLTEPIPVEITAHNRAEFLTDGKGAIRQVTFMGNVLAQSKAESRGELLLRRFFGEKLVVDLDQDPNGVQRIRHISLQDQRVLFESIHFLDQKKVNHVRLYCRQFDYEANGNKITADGPGTLELSNQKVPPVSDSTKRFSLTQPCFAYMEGFDKLLWNLDLNSVLAYGKESMYLNYWPVEGGILGDQVIVECVHVQAQFASAGQGRNELIYLKTSGGVEYREEKEKGNYLQGDSLTYEQGGEWMIIEGTEARPCKANGVRVPIIRHNPRTGEIKFKLSTAPGSLPVPSQLQRN